MSIDSLKKEILNIGKNLYKLGFSPAASGNISIRLDDKILISPTGKCLGFMEIEDIVLIDFKGNSLEPGKIPSSEKEMHIEIYKLRSDINAIIHAHPPKSTSFAVAGIPLNKPILAEAVISLGNVPVAKYATPSSLEVAKNTAQQCKDNNAVLMANHGVVSIGKNILDALYRLETLESFAEITLWSKVLGTCNELSSENISELMQIKEKLK